MTDTLVIIVLVCVLTLSQCIPGDLELLELLAPHVNPTSHPLALYELLGTCAQHSFCGTLGTQILDTLSSSVTESNAKHSKKNRKQKDKQNDSVPPSTHSSVETEHLQSPQQPEREHQWRGLVDSLLQRHGRDWAEASSDAMGSAPIAGEPPTLLHLAVVVGLPPSLLQVKTYLLRRCQCMFIA